MGQLEDLQTRKVFKKRIQEALWEIQETINRQFKQQLIGKIHKKQNKHRKKSKPYVLERLEVMAKWVDSRVCLALFGPYTCWRLSLRSQIADRTNSGSLWPIDKPGNCLFKFSKQGVELKTATAIPKLEIRGTAQPKLILIGKANWVGTWSAGLGFHRKRGNGYWCPAVLFSVCLLGAVDHNRSRPGGSNHV